MEQLNGDHVDDAKELRVSNDCISETPDLKGDWLHFYLLILLYIVQGFTVGLYLGISIILQSNKSVTFEDQAIFSLASWPYSFKLLFAPIVDAFYIKWIGRRKSWLIFLQILIVAFLIYLTNNIEDWAHESEKPNLKMLVIVLFFIIFLTAIQDIVVDGWSLEMLKKRNVGYSSVCGSVGTMLGVFIGSVCFVLLVSEQFKSKFVQTTPGSGGLITKKTFFTFLSISIFAITTLIGIFKKEIHPDEDEDISVLQNYKLLWDILKLPRIRVLTIALLTFGAGLLAAGPATHFKLIDAGISKDDLMVIRVVMFGANLVMSVFVSKYIASTKSMTYFMKLMPIRLLVCVVQTVLVYYTPSLILKEGSVPLYYVFTLSIMLIIDEMMSFFMNSAVTSFFSHISDPRFGGTYMTLLNTFTNLGRDMTLTIGLKLVGILTYSTCSNVTQDRCDTTSLKNVCEKNGGICNVYLDGYFIIIPVSVVLGFIWYGIFKNVLKKYQSLSLSHWIVYKHRLDSEEVIELKKPEE